MGPTAGPADSVFVTLEQFFAIGDGIANDSAAVDAALEYGGNTGARIMGTPGKTYRIATDITIARDDTSAPLIFDLNGSTLFMDDAGMSASGVSTPFLTTTLAIEPIKGASNITLTSAAGVRQGDLVEILSPALSQGTITVYHMYVVSEVDGDQIWLEGTVVADINAAQIVADGKTGSISVLLYHPANSFQMMNGFIDAYDPDGLRGSVSCRYHLRVLYHNLVFGGHTRFQCRSEWCGFSTVTDCTFRDFGYLSKDQGYVNAPEAPDAQGFGYGFLTSRVYQSFISRCKGGKGWHMTDTSRGTMHCIVDNCFLMRNSFGVSSHECAWYFTIRNCIFDGGNGIIGARCVYLIVEGCTFRHLREQAITYAAQTEVRIRDCLFDCVDSPSGVQSTTYNAGGSAVPANGVTSANWERVWEMRNCIHLGPIRVHAGQYGTGRMVLSDNVLDQGAIFYNIACQNESYVERNITGNVGGNIGSFLNIADAQTVTVRGNIHTGGYTAGVTSWMQITGTGTPVINFYDNLVNADYIVRFGNTSTPIANFIGNVNRSAAGRTFLNGATTNIVTNFFDNRWGMTTFLSGGITITNEDNNTSTALPSFADNTTNFDQTLTPFQSTKIRRYTATLTADRTITLSLTNAVQGQQWRIIRTGGGAFLLKIMGATLLASLKQYEWCEVTYNGTAWVLTAYDNIYSATFSEITPQMFGAVGNGTTDDSAAFTAMLTYVYARRTGASSSSIPKIRLPAGKYLLTTVGVLSNPFAAFTDGLTFSGDGMGCTELIYDNASVATDNHAFSSQNLRRVCFENMTIRIVQATSKFIKWYNSGSGTGSHFRMSNVNVEGAYLRFFDVQGTTLGSETYWEYISGTVPSTGSFFYVESTNPQSVNHTFVGCIMGCRGILFELNGGGNIRWFSGYTTFWDGATFLKLRNVSSSIGGNNKDISIYGWHPEVASGETGNIKIVDANVGSFLFDACNFNQIASPVDQIVILNTGAQKSSSLIFRDCISPKRVAIHDQCDLLFDGCEMAAWDAVVTSYTRNESSNYLSPRIQVKNRKLGPDADPFFFERLTPSSAINNIPPLYSAVAGTINGDRSCPLKRLMHRAATSGTQAGLSVNSGGVYGAANDITIPLGSIVTAIWVVFIAGATAQPTQVRTLKAENFDGSKTYALRLLTDDGTQIYNTEQSFAGNVAGVFRSADLWHKAYDANGQLLKVFMHQTQGTAGTLIQDFGYIMVDYY